MDADFRRMQYVRYADDFLISVIGSKSECETIIKHYYMILFLEKRSKNCEMLI